MQISLSILAMAGAALGAAAPVLVSREYTAVDACVCPWAVKERGTNIAQGNEWYQCAYEAGACTWTKDGLLVNKAQKNCASFASCIVGIRD